MTFSVNRQARRPNGVSLVAKLIGFAAVWPLLLYADPLANPGPHRANTTATQSKIALYVGDVSPNCARAYAFNATLLNPISFPNPYVGVFHSESPEQPSDCLGPSKDAVSAVYGLADAFGTAVGPFQGGCYSGPSWVYGTSLCSAGVGAFGPIPPQSTYHHYVHNDYLVTGGGTGFMQSGAGNPHLVTANADRYALYFLTGDAQSHNYMMAAQIDAGYLGNIRYAPAAYLCANGAACPRAANAHASGSLYGITDAEPITERGIPSDPNDNTTILPEGAPIKSGASTGSGGLIGSMTTDPDARAYTATLTNPGYWSGKQFFYYTDSYTESGNLVSKLKRRRIMPYIYGMGPAEDLQVDITFDGSPTPHYNSSNPAPYIIVNYSNQLDRFVVAYYCNGSWDQEMDICIQTSSYGDLRRDDGGRMQIHLNYQATGSSDRTTYGLNMTADAGIADRKNTAGEFTIGQFGARLDGFGMLVNSTHFQGSPLMLYFPVSNPTVSPAGDTAGVQLYVKGVTFSQ